MDDRKLRLYIFLLQQGKIELDQIPEEYKKEIKLLLGLEEYN
jgi:hypothetical protein